MAGQTKSKNFSLFSGLQKFMVRMSPIRGNVANVAIMIFVGLIFGIMLMPLPAFLLDLFMACNLAFGLIMVLIVMLNRRTVDFSIFPQMLLVSTLFGLSLNISSTRLILQKGIDFNGSVVRTFASFVIGGGSGNQGLIVGVIIFLILIAVQYFVVTKGASRVSEVAARFTLDSLPAKQMAVDAEFNQGIITEEEMKQRRKDLQKESDFYGSMDGASKFVSGNVLVGFLMTAVNLIGGIAIGLIEKNYTFDQAVKNYTMLTIGDGLVSQFPSLFISVAMGLMVTRSISDQTMGEEVKTQFSKQKMPYIFSGIFFLLMGIVFGGPNFFIFSVVGIALFLLGFFLSRSEKKEIRQAASQEAKTQTKTSMTPESTTVSPPDVLQIELGYGLIPLADESKGGDLLDRIGRVRQIIAKQLGLVVPEIRIVDNMSLQPTEYRINIKGNEVGRGSIKRGYFMAIDSGAVTVTMEGEATVDPTYGMPAIWIREEERSRAEALGYDVVDGVSIIVTHLNELIKIFADELIGRQNVKDALELLKNKYPAAVSDAEKLPLGDIQKVLQALLREGISIRNMVTILETLGDYANVQGEKNIGFLAEQVRLRLKHQIVTPHVDENKVLKVLTLDPQLENAIVNSLVPTGNGQYSPALDLNTRQLMFSSIQQQQESMLMQEQRLLPILTGGNSRRFVWDLVRAVDRNIPVLSIPEIPDGIQIVPMGNITTNIINSEEKIS